jgi:hypothetical protein
MMGRDRLRKRAVWSVVGLLLATTLSTAVARPAPQLWFSPGDDLEVSGVVTHPDFPKLFEEPRSGRQAYRTSTCSNFALHTSPANRRNPRNTTAI